MKVLQVSLKKVQQDEVKADRTDLIYAVYQWCQLIVFFLNSMLQITSILSAHKLIYTLFDTI